MRSYPQLDHPPIVEATIHWLARPANRVDPDVIEAALSEHFPNYTTRKMLHQIEVRAFVSSKADESVIQQKKDWDAFRMESDDNRYVIQFKRDGLVFSQVRAYEHWEHFTGRAKEAWANFIEIAAPAEVQRLGVRFINRISSATMANLGDYLCDPPTCPSSLPLKEFVYQSTFEVPNIPYGVRVIKVMQPSMPELKDTSGLILDIDVYTTSVISTDPKAIEDALAQIRLLKNEVFFTLVKEPVKLFGTSK